MKHDETRTCSTHETPRNVAETFMRQVHADPRRIAVVDDDTEFTYRRMNVEVNRWAHFLLRLGVHQGDRVAYLLPNCSQLLFVYYAIQKIGAVAVPLNYRSIPRELRYLCASGNARVLVFDAASSERVHRAFLDTSDTSPDDPELTHTPELVCATVPNRHPEGASDDCSAWAHQWESQRHRMSGADVLIRRNPDAVSRIQFTGGTTGSPKGVMRTHRADLVEIQGICGSNRIAEDEAKVVLIHCPLEHHGGHSWFTMAFAAGATVVLISGFDPEVILSRIEQYRVSYMILLPPGTHARVMEHPSIDSFDLSSVRLVQSSAGGITPKIVHDIYHHFPRCRLNFGWGQSESGLGSSTVLEPEWLNDEDPRLASIGTPMPLIDMRIVDDWGLDMAPGDVGECVVSSEAVMSGYSGQPLLTDAAFTPDGWLRTGDLMMRDDNGYFYLKSRKRELIKSGGENVFVAEVEAIVRRHPAVADCVIYGAEDPVMGEAVAAIVELHPGWTLQLEELQDFCRRHLASYKKPRSLTIKTSLGRNLAGKVNRDQLAGISREQDDGCTPRSSAIWRSVPDSPSCADASGEAADADCTVVRISATSFPDGKSSAMSCHSYLLTGGGQALLIDPLPDLPQAWETTEAALEAAGVTRMDQLTIWLNDPSRADTIVTSRLRGWGTRVFTTAGVIEAIAELRSCSDNPFGPPQISEFRAVEAEQRFCIGNTTWTPQAMPGVWSSRAILRSESSKAVFTGQMLRWDRSPWEGFDRRKHPAARADLSEALTMLIEYEPRWVFPGGGPVRSTLCERARYLHPAPETVMTSAQ